MSIGYFNDKGREYVITDMFPRRKLLNYLWNDTIVCACDQFGCGTSWSVINGERRPIEAGEREFTIRNGERLIYIKDNDTGEYYSPNRNHERLKFDVFECHVGLGYQKVIGEYKGVRTEFIIQVPQSGNVVQFSVKVKNNSDVKKHINMYFYMLPKLDSRAGSGGENTANYDEELHGIYYSHDSYKTPIIYKKSYLSSEKTVNGFAVTDTQFKGVYGSYEKPYAVENDTLMSEGSTFQEEYAGAFRYKLNLSVGETFETVIACGFGKDREDCLKDASIYANRENFDKEFLLQKEKNEEMLDIFNVQSPDRYFNSMANIWLKRQLSLGKTWGRLYGKGFRDTMQDTSAFVSLDLPMARQRIVEILKHQYEDGNPIRMFEPDLRLPYNDSGSWIPATVLEYLYESGDISVMDEMIPYIKGDSYENAYTGNGFLPYIGTEEKYTVFDHVRRAMDYLYKSRGKRGLVLFREGDWNDSLNGVGVKGIGESVWLTIATVKAYNEFIEILKYIGKSELISEYAKRRDELKTQISKYGWEDGYLIYGYDDYDCKIGSKESDYAKIFLNPQAWAALANIDEKEKLNRALDIAEEKLGCPYGYTVCAPAYEKGDDKVGRMSYACKGITENGSVYNHGVAFKIVADCVLGRGDNAYKTLKMISYDNPNNSDNGVEPYAVTNMYIGPESPFLKGFAPMAWVTGTAGWLYRALTEFICGIRPVEDGLLAQPCFPNEWNEVFVKRKYRGAIYEIRYVRSNEYKIVFDGTELKGNVLPIGKIGEKHYVEVKFN